MFESIIDMGWVCILFVWNCIVALTPPALMFWVCWRLGRTKYGQKYGEGVFLALTILLMIGLPWFYAYTGRKYDEADSHMRAALIRCGEMLKNGEREVLAQKLAAFAGSPEMELEPVPLSAAFQKAVGAEEPPPGRGVMVRMLSCGWYGAACLALLGIWAAMFRWKVKGSLRRNYGTLLFALLLYGMGLLLLSDVVRKHYTCGRFRADVRFLSELVSRPEIPPDLLPQLENPEPCGFSYIRLPGAPNPGPFF